MTTTIMQTSESEVSLEQPLRSRADHKTWHTLITRQLPLLEGKASMLLWKGLETGVLDPTRVPDREAASAIIHDRTGWKLIRAKARYLTDEEWFTPLSRKEFPVTDFIRAPDQIDFTPEPDLFHDFFGHLPQMVHPRIANLAHKFGLAFVAAKDDFTRQSIGRLWWHTIEFGLMKENGHVVTLGAGLWSSHQELLHCQDTARWRLFDLKEIVNKPKAVENVHETFMVLDSLDQLEEALEVLARGKVHELME